jgi:hypothetical protein
MGGLLLERVGGMVEVEGEDDDGGSNWSDHLMSQTPVDQSLRVDQTDSS